MKWHRKCLSYTILIQITPSFKHRKCIMIYWISSYPWSCRFIIIHDCLGLLDFLRWSQGLSELFQQQLGLLESIVNVPILGPYGTVHKCFLSVTSSLETFLAILLQPLKYSQIYIQYCYHCLNFSVLSYWCVIVTKMDFILSRIRNNSIMF